MDAVVVVVACGLLIVFIGVAIAVAEVYEGDEYD